MTSLLIIPGSSQPPPELPLVTAKNNHIPNSQSNDIGNFNWSILKGLYKRYTDRASVQFLGSACARYNCHGLTFGCRRTEVDGHNSTIHGILEDDSYIILGKETPVQVGDLAIYYHKSGDLEHSAIVVEVRKFNDIAVPFVWSKWGKGPEVLHNANMGEYAHCEIVYYRKQNCSNCHCHTSKT